MMLSCSLLFRVERWVTQSLNYPQLLVELHQRSLIRTWNKEQMTSRKLKQLCLVILILLVIIQGKRPKRLKNKSKRKLLNSVRPQNKLIYFCSLNTDLENPFRVICKMIFLQFKFQYHQQQFTVFCLWVAVVQFISDLLQQESLYYVSASHLLLRMALHFLSVEEQLVFTTFFHFC